MKLLVTNDDGIDSVFFHELVFALRDAGHDIYLVAPAREQSWTGASKTKARPVKATKVDRGFGRPTWIVDGTPSDCVNIAVAHLLPGAPIVARADSREWGVVSGINVGTNCTLGFILASGTVAGAWEGALHGLPAIAFSHDVSEQVYAHLKDHGGEPDPALRASLKCSAVLAARLTRELLATTPAHSFTVHNVNFPFPCRPEAEMKRTVPARLFVPGLFSPADDNGSHRLVWCLGQDVSPPEPLTDLKCVASGCISHTVLDYRKLGHG
jgi:5'-nucleotidase